MRKCLSTTWDSVARASARGDAAARGAGRVGIGVCGRANVNIFRPAQTRPARPDGERSPGRPQRDAPRGCKRSWRRRGCLGGAWRSAQSVPVSWPTSRVGCAAPRTPPGGWGDWVWANWGCSRLTARSPVNRSSSHGAGPPFGVFAGITRRAVVTRTTTVDTYPGIPSATPGQIPGVGGESVVEFLQGLQRIVQIPSACSCRWSIRMTSEPIRAT